MFRKPKRKLKQSLRKKDEDEDKKEDAATQDGDEASTTELLDEARKRLKQGGKDETVAEKKKEQSILHTFDTSKEPTQDANAALATSTALHHPDKEAGTDAATRGADGMFRAGRNKFWAGPIKAATNVRVTARFDYQPDICKDYKETGFCGFGDTCIYLHDRGDSLSGWQLEEKWQEEHRLKKEQQEKELNAFLEQASGGKPSASRDDKPAMTDDGLPFACHLCRNAFTDPVNGTDPTANATYGGSGEQVIYNGSGNSVVVSSTVEFASGAVHDRSPVVT